jgi:ATP-dependent Clp protease ATP-binding subunit ClpC
MEKEHAEQEVKNDGGKSILDNFSTDLTKLAEEDLLDPVIGRDKEVVRIAQILSRRKKNNPILLGDPGVGKSALAELLAQKIVSKKVPRTLYDKRVLVLDMASMVAGTKYRGQFEERIKAVVDELKKKKNIIIFIDEIHTIVGAGGASGSLDAANMLKPALARGEIQCIGATTLDEYRKVIEKDGALERRFQKIIVRATTVDETIEILKNVKSRYEEHHNVEYTPEAIEACVKLTNRYITDRVLPDKAMDALDEAGSRTQISEDIPKSILEIEEKIENIKKDKMQSVKDQDFEKAAEYRDKERNLSNDLKLEKKKWDEELAKNKKTVGKEEVAEVVSLMSGVPVTDVDGEESEKLAILDKKLEGLVIGQDEAVQKVVRAIHRSRSGLKDPNRPMGSFIFLGASGVGKTELCKVLARELFDSEDNLIRVDMSEYMEKHSVSKLTGSPPGYVGYEEGGQLTEKVRRKPYSVILLDEVEKAHTDAFNVFLQILDEGHATDSLGRKVDFKNTIIIMTSNLGVKQMSEFGQGIGFQSNEGSNIEEERKNDIITKAMKKHFKPEFLNRVDDIVIFNSLKKDDLIKIVDLQLDLFRKRVEGMKMKLEVSKPVKEYLCEVGYDKQFGARPLKRAIQKYIEDPLAEMLIKKQAGEGSVIKVSYTKKSEELVIKIK